MILDLIGYASYIIPTFAEAIDIVWAPLYGVIILVMYQDIIAGIVATGEELLPYVDALPSATIFWFISTFISAKGKKGKTLFKVFKIFKEKRFRKK